MTCTLLSGPYSAPSAAVRGGRAETAGGACAWLSVRGDLLLSPVAQWYEPAARNGLPAEAEHWTRWNREWLRRADAIAVLQLDGWERSRGVAMKRAWALALRLPEMVIEPRDGGFAWRDEI